jgi:quercetin dioxygenase-like cupin family protein
MEIADGHDGSYEPGDAARFSGQVSLRPSFSTPSGTGMSVVHFAAGARTHWHRHPEGQLLYAISGRGWVRSRDGQSHLLARATSSTRRRASGISTAAARTARWRTSR